MVLKLLILKLDKPLGPFIQYEYMTTKDGEFLADVPDRNNHAIDATRYALDRIINYKKISA